MILGILFLFLFPVLAFTVLSFPLFLILKNRLPHSITIFLLVGSVSATVFSYVFLELLNSLNDQPIEFGGVVVLALSIYGSFLGVFYWHTSNKEEK